MYKNVVQTRMKGKTFVALPVMQEMILCMVAQSSQVIRLHSLISAPSYFSLILRWIKIFISLGGITLNGPLPADFLSIEEQAAQWASHNKYSQASHVSASEFVDMVIFKSAIHCKSSLHVCTCANTIIPSRCVSLCG
jgi:hypothetical protein